MAETMMTRVGLMVFLAVWAATPLGAAEPDALLTNSDAPYVHVLTLYDAEGRAISPSKGETTPFSMEATCAKCHDVAAIRGGWHFNANHSGVERGRPGEPWLLVDQRTGTQLPLSHRGWPGTWNPADIGLDDHEFVKLFGRHLPGGGAGHPDPANASDAWAASGSFEIDCLACHAIDQATYAPNERAKLTSKGEFASVSFVSLRLGTVRNTDEAGATGQSSKDAFAEFDPALEGEAKKQLVEFLYDLSRFDANDRVLLPMTRGGSDDGCLQCHTTREHQADPTSTQWRHDDDVHTLAGLACTDCHRNGIDHAMVRGYEGESADPLVASLTCAGCHYGVEAEEGPVHQGRLGAPLPGHAGLPPVHFEVMTCTACHSGPMPDDTLAALQTSMSHGLGFAEFGRAQDTAPFIQGPLFVRDAHGRIAPHKVVWPAYWAWRGDNGDEVLAPARVIELAGAALPASAPKDKTTPTLTNEMIRAALLALAKHAPASKVPVYVSAGNAWMMQGESLVPDARSGAQPYAWPLAHNVRPAGMALGARGCQECHAGEADFATTSVEAHGPMPQLAGEPTPMLVAMEWNGGLHEWWSMAFATRSAYKVAIAILLLFSLMGAMAATWAAMPCSRRSDAR